MPVTSRARRARDRWVAVTGSAVDWMSGGPHSLYGVAVARILFGLGAVLLVLRNWADRDFFWGAGSAWTEPFRETSPWPDWLFGFFGADDAGAVLAVKLSVLLLAGLCMTLGVAGRWPVAVVLVLTTSLLRLSPTSVDTEDTITRIMLVYLLLCRPTARLSLDRWWALRRARAGRPAPRVPRLPDRVATPMHNAGVVLICGQLCLVYVAAALAKLRGATWRDGTAMTYALHTDRYTPWPEASHLLTQWPLLVLAMTWGAVLVQLSFPVLVLIPRTRMLAVGGLLLLHLGIAVLMGLGLFSLAMVAADAVFVRDRSVERLMRRWRRRPPEPQRSSAASMAAACRSRSNDHGESNAVWVQPPRGCWMSAGPQK